MDDLIQEFLVESNENLDRVDSELVKLESDPSSAELLASIFRGVHSIKGACGFLGFNKLQTLAHGGENLLSKLRDGTLPLNPEISSALLAMVDGIRQMLAAIAATGQDGDEDFADIVEMLKRLQEGAVGAQAGPSVANPPTTTPVALPPPPPPVSEAAPTPSPAASKPSKKKKYQPQPGKLGGALLERKRIQIDDLVRALEAQEAGDSRPLGEILVVDDSLVVRSVLTDILRADPATELVGTASNGENALVKIPQLKPDVITLDIEMPGMSGLQTLAQIRKLYPKLPVIMFSTLTEHGAAATLEALALGATDYAAKPTSSEGLNSARAQVQRELIAKITALRGPAIKVPPPVSHPASRRPISGRIDIVAIGTSTGGPNALGEVIPQFPADFPVPVAIVQHMPPLFTRLLAKHLSVRSPLLVEEGQPGVQLVPGRIWIAPGDYHMTVSRAGEVFRLSLNQDSPEHSCRAAVDVLFRSVARTFGPHALAVVMTGMGSDGTLGSKAIHQAGGEVIVQDQASSVVWGMPGSVVTAALADSVYSLSTMAGEIVRRVNTRRPGSMHVANNRSNSQSRTEHREIRPAR